jgi:hypothetical protein
LKAAGEIFRIKIESNIFFCFLEASNVTF